MLGQTKMRTDISGVLYISILPHGQKTCTDLEINMLFSVYGSLLTHLQILFAILRKKRNHLLFSDIAQAQEHCNASAKLWRMLDLNWTPKMHILTHHSVEFLIFTDGY